MYVLLPCYSLESLALERDSKEVNELLSAWSALFHPACIEKQGALPKWENASSPLRESQVPLYVIPPCCDSLVPEDWYDLKTERGTLLIRHLEHRHEIVDEVLRLWNLENHGFDPEFVADLLALGTTYILVEIMTRQLRYMSMLDESQLKTRVLDAIREYRADDREKATESLKSAFELLAESKEYFYPTTSYLLDLTLTDSLLTDSSLFVSEGTTTLKSTETPTSENEGTPTLGEEEKIALKDQETTLKDEESAMLRNEATTRNDEPLSTESGCESLSTQNLEKSVVFGERLRNAIARSPFVNLYLPTEHLREMVQFDPQTIAVLREGLAKGRIELIGDDWDSTPLPLLPLGSIADRIVRGIHYYQEHLGKRPNVYGRVRKGLTPVLPQLLQLAGFQGAVHFTPQDGWSLTKETQSKISWIGLDGSKIETLLKYPYNAEEDETFFKLPKKMGYSMNNDQASTFILAHKPFKESLWLSDLIRGNQYCAVLGEMLKLSEYFQKTRFVGADLTFGFGKYWANFLLQSVRDGRTTPVSDWAVYYRLYRLHSVAEILRTMNSMITRTEEQDRRLEEMIAKHFDQQFQTVENRLFGNAGENVCVDFSATRELLELLLTQLAYTVYGKPIEEIGRLPDSQIAELVGLFVVNPLNFTRTVLVDVSELPRLPEERGKVRLARRFVKNDEVRQEVMLELPPLGYVWVGPGPKKEQPIQSAKIEYAGESRSTEKEVVKKGFLNAITRLFQQKKAQPGEEPPLIERITEKIERRGEGIREESFYLLRNDYFEVRVEQLTGAIRSINTFNQRGNRCAQQIVFRVPSEDRQDDPRAEGGIQCGYSIMCADQIEILSSSPLCGRLQIRGRLMRQDGVLAGRFEQILTIKRLCKVLELEMKIDPTLEPGEKVWDSYFANRVAWSDSLLDVRGGVHGSAFPMKEDLLQTPEFIDLRNEKGSLTILTGGLPYHRVFDGRWIDSVLIPRGESGRSFRLGIGVDLPNPQQAATDFLLNDFDATGMIPAPKFQTAWLFATDTKNVQIVQLEPVFSPEFGNRATNIGNNVSERQSEVTQKQSNVSEQQNNLPTQPNDPSKRQNVKWERDNQGVLDKKGDLGNQGNWDNEGNKGEQGHKEGNNVENKSATQEVRLGRLSGFKVILQETDNRPSTFCFRTFLSVKRAFKTDLLGNPGEELSLEEDGIRLSVHGRELLPFEIEL
ncbi:MAG: hypothetical protein ACRC10_10585 [Thermoguttaceae bacterium]